MENIIWTILIIVLILFSIVITKEIKFKNYNIKKLIIETKKSSKDGLFLSLATKVGVGSIIGISSSIVLAGPSTIIWMMLFSLLTSSLIYYETYNGIKYKKENIGGPFSFIKNKLNNKVLAFIFLIIITVCYSLFFQMVQTNTITDILVRSMKINKILIAAIFFILILFLLFFSLNELIKLSNKLVPIMLIIYILLGIIIIFKNILIMPNILINMFLSIFNKKSFITGLIIGIKRSIFANEIMIGTTSISASINGNEEYSSSSSVLAVYFITFVISLITSFIVLIYLYYSKLNYINYNYLIIDAFNFHFGKLGTIFLILILFLFAFTTIISGCFIGINNIKLISNNNKKNLIFKIIMLLFCICGVFIKFEKIWKVLDYLLLILILINTYSLYKIYRCKNDR